MIEPFDGCIRLHSFNYHEKCAKKLFGIAEETLSAKMELTPVKFLSLFFLLASIGYIFFTWIGRLLAQLLSKKTGAVVSFRIAGLNILKDFSLQFHKGPLASITISEVRFNLRKSTNTTGGNGAICNSKMHLSICEVDVALRLTKSKKNGQKKDAKNYSTGRGKWVVVMNIAKYLNISVNDVTIKDVQTPSIQLDIKEVEVEMFKETSTFHSFGVKVLLAPCIVYLGENKGVDLDSSISRIRERILSVGGLASTQPNKKHILLSLEHLALKISFDHDREVGVRAKQMEVTCGDVALDLSAEKCLVNGNLPSQLPTCPGDSTVDGSEEEASNHVSENPVEQFQKRDFTSDVSMSKFTKKIPEKIQFSLPKLQMKLCYEEKKMILENNVFGVSIQIMRSRPPEGSSDIVSVLEMQLDCGEIHVLHAADASLLEILKVATVASVELPLKLGKPIHVEIDVKLGGTKFNLLVNKFDDWLQCAPLLSSTIRRNPETSGNSRQRLKRSSSGAAIQLSWNCSISAPEMCFVVYNMDGLPVSHVCSQTSHFYINSIPRKGIGLHVEFVELCINMVENEGECANESSVGMDTSCSCLLRISRLDLDSGVLERDLGEDDNQKEVKFIVEGGDCEVFLNLAHMRAVLSIVMAAEACMKTLKAGMFMRGHRKVVQQRKDRKEMGKLKAHLDKLCIEYRTQCQVDAGMVKDSKKVNFGCQGGEVLVSMLDGKPRSAYLYASKCHELPHSQITQRAELKLLDFCMLVECDKPCTRIEVDQSKIVYQELDSRGNIFIDEILTGINSVKVVYQHPASAFTNHSLVSATNLVARWDPDALLFFHMLYLQLKDLLDVRKIRSKDGSNLPSGPAKPKQIKQHAPFAVDIEEMSLSAGLADGVEGSLHIQSVFSEDASIGMLFENVDISFNSASVLRNQRLQISRVPYVGNKQAITESDHKWDCIVQANGTHVMMPYRLPLRAIDDAIEDTWRALKLAMEAQKKTFCTQGSPRSVSKKKRTSVSYCLRFHMRDITAEIEEEPFQGWLDEHYHILKREIREAFVLEEFMESKSGKQATSVVETQASDQSHHDIKRIKDKAYRQALKSYQKSCKKLTPCRGSGACDSGFQSGFKPSKARASLFSISASSLDISLTEIPGGRDGMIKCIRELDCVGQDVQVPFSRVYGRHMTLSMSTLSVNIRNYSSPLLSAAYGQCEGNVIFAQQATMFPKQMVQELYVGRWRKIEMLRSISGSTPPFKCYLGLPIKLNEAKVCYGVGYEPAIADISYAFTVALRKSNLSIRSKLELSGSSEYLTAYFGNAVERPVKREKSLPWWDDMRYYIHGKNSIDATNFEWIFLASTDPYEQSNMMRLCASKMLIEQSEGKLSFSGQKFDIRISSLESSTFNSRSTLKEKPVLVHSPLFRLDISMKWDCASGKPNNHYLHPFPNAPESQPKVYDPFRSTSLSLDWSFSLRSCKLGEDIKTCDDITSKSSLQKASSGSLIEIGEPGIPCMNLGSHDLVWIFKWWNLYFNPPHKIRSFSRWPRFGVQRIPRSGNLSLDKVLTEFILRVDATPACIKHFSLAEDDPAKGLTFNMQKLRYELCYSRGRQRFTFETKRDILELVYQGLDIHLLKAKLVKGIQTSSGGVEVIKKSEKVKELLGCTEVPHNDVCQDLSRQNRKRDEDGFLFTTDCFTIRRQSPKADPTRLSSWREHARLHDEGLLHNANSDSGSDQVNSDPSDDDGFSVVCDDNCLRVSLYGLKLFWNLANRDAVWAWVGDISRAFESPKPSPSRHYAQRKLLKQKQQTGDAEKLQETATVVSADTDVKPTSYGVLRDKASEDKGEEGTLQFMVNVIQPQFNLHSEDAHGRFLLAAASGRVLARSFHSIFYVGFEMIEQALGTISAPLQGSLPEISWKRRELSLLLEHVQAHAAPTDVDPGAGLQWLPRIPRGEPQVKRTGALLERVFMPCTMYFQYTRHKGGTTDCKVKPLKELSFNSPNITATMTSHQFHIMVDVISSLLLARLPKPRKNTSSFYGEEEEGAEEESDEVVPDGVEEVELARIKLEQVERDCTLLIDDLKILNRTISSMEEGSGAGSPEQVLISETQEASPPRTSGLVKILEKELTVRRKARKSAYASLRAALQRAAQQRLMEKEKNKSPSAAMRISWAIDKVVWSMLSDCEAFAEAEISNMILNVDRDFNDIGVAKFTIKSFVVKNCLPAAKSVLSAWNEPKEWGRNVMLRVDARQGAPKDGVSPLEHFLVEIFPLKIHLTEAMYTMMWQYFFPDDEQDARRRQEVWKVSTTSGTKRSRKGAAATPETASTQASTKREGDISTKSANDHGSGLDGVNLNSRDIQQDFTMTMHAAEVSGLPQKNSAPVLARDADHYRSSSFDRTWEDDGDILAAELLMRSEYPMIADEFHAVGTSYTDNSGTKPRENRRVSKTGSKLHDEKKTRRAFMEFHNITISQVELQVTYEGSRFAVNDLRLLMDTFTRATFTGSWRRLFSRVKKHIIWGVLKSVTGMQGKKFKDKSQSHGHNDDRESDSNSSDSCASNICMRERFPIPHFQRQTDRAGEGFVSSIRGLFNSQRRKAKALVRRTMRGEGNMEWSDGEADLAHFARQLSRTKQILKLRSRKFRPPPTKAKSLHKQASPQHSESGSSDSSTYEDPD